MIEQTREIVRSFNMMYKEILVEPEAVLPDNQLCARLPGLDGAAKMSKSLGNCIYISDSEKDIKKKVQSMFTDPLHLRVEDPGHLEGNAVFTYLDAFSKDEHFSEFLPQYNNLDELKAHYQKGGLGDGTVKKFLNEILQNELRPIREKREEFQKDLGEVFNMLQKGSEQAREVAASTLDEVKTAMGINYFKGNSLIK
jgi:tryptophanyl-tRNA synthetase